MQTYVTNSLFKGIFVKSLILISLLLLSSCARFKTPTKAPVKAPAPAVVLNTPKTIEEAVASPYRTDSNRARDVYRHPSETLHFFGLKANMKVIEITPGNGWYMEIIAPFLNDQGQYIMATSVAGANEGQVDRLVEWSKKHPEIAKNMSVVTFNLTSPKAKLAKPSSVDMILTFRNVHNWMAKKTEKVAFKLFYKALKKGGILGVVEHRALATAKDPKALSGYVRESDMIKMAKKAGFRLVAKSEINANPKDTKDYPDGVWTLPPTLKLKEKNREKYLAIGESDRMTLKFIKP